MKTNPVPHYLQLLSIVTSLIVTACNPSKEKTFEAQDSTSLTAISGFGDPVLEIPDSLHRSTISVARHYTGALNDKYMLGMNIIFENDRTYGAYRYATQKEFISFRGSFGSDNKFKLEESTYTEKDGAQVTGYFEGERIGNDLKGTWFNKDRTKSFPFTLTEDAKPYKGWIFTDNAKKEEGFYVMSNIYIWNAQGQLHQTLSDFQCTSDTENTIEIEDLNFDGHMDIRVLEMSGSVNAPYIYWLYDPREDVFVRNEELAGITSPEVDVMGKEIISRWRSGAASYGTDHYTYSNGHFILGSREENNYAEEEEEGEDGSFTDEGGVE